jgi:hypothetical protein
MSLAVVAILFMACNKESVQSEQSEPVREVIHKVFASDNLDGNEVFPARGLYGENLLSEEITVIKRGYQRPSLP